jgi:aryl-alcohol dehydrogenase-like predicted oxidoreductase
MTELPKRELGRTGLEVTMLGYGAMELRGAPRARDISEAQAETILNAVLDSGINYIDTSIDYGLSEERIGRYIGHRRDEYYLASKCGCLVGAPRAPRGDRSPHVFTPENIIAGVEQELASHADRSSRCGAVPQLAIAADASGQWRGRCSA